jgi:hypothetical protein
MVKIGSENRNKYSCVEGFTDTLINIIEMEKGKKFENRAF